MASTLTIHDYFDLEQGVMAVNGDGSNTWKKEASGKHARLLFKIPKDQLTDVIERMMMHKPGIKD